jgi:hypothetical protein
MGYGDYLMLVGRARRLRSMLGTKLQFLSPDSEGSTYFREVILNNPYFILSKDKDPNVQYMSISRSVPSIADSFLGSVEDNPFPGEVFLIPKELEQVKDLTESLARHKKRPLLFTNFSTKRFEIVGGKKEVYPNYVNRAPSPSYVYRLKRMLGQRFTCVSSSLEDKSFIVDDIILPTISYRVLVGIMSVFDAYLGAEGGCHHAAASAGLRGVVFFGSWLSPQKTGYSFHYNLASGTLPDLNANHVQFLRTTSPDCIASVNHYPVETVSDLLESCLLCRRFS